MGRTRELQAHRRLPRKGLQRPPRPLSARFAVIRGQDLAQRGAERPEARLCPRQGIGRRRPGVGIGRINEALEICETAGGPVVAHNRRIAPPKRLDKLPHRY